MQYVMKSPGAAAVLETMAVTPHGVTACGVTAVWCDIAWRTYKNRVESSVPAHCTWSLKLDYQQVEGLQ